jgi:hypothetical protein
MVMAQSIGNAALVGALILGVVGIGTTTARADSSPSLHGVVERLPGTPDLVGEWSVGGRTLTVDRQTRIERHARAEAGYWTQEASGVVLRAPGWPADAARAAGFRPASAEDLAGFRPGRVVKARLAPGADGRPYVTKIELEQDHR